MKAEIMLYGIRAVEHAALGHLNSIGYVIQQTLKTV